MKNSMRRKRNRVYLDTEIRCPNCNNFLVEIVQLPHDFCSNQQKQEEEELVVIRRSGFYCTECGSAFSPELIIDPD